MSACEGIEAKESLCGLEQKWLAQQKCLETQVGGRSKPDGSMAMEVMGCVLQSGHARKVISRK